MITANDKLAAIREAGYRVCVSHRRSCRKISGQYGPMQTFALDNLTAHEARQGGWDIDIHGGYTTVAVIVDTDATAVTIATGRADCSPVDRFDKHVGLKVALDRAIASAPELRAIIGKLTQVSEYDRMLAAVADSQGPYAETLVDLLEDAVADGEVHGLDVLDALASSGLALLPVPGAATIAYQKKLS